MISLTTILLFFLVVGVWLSPIFGYWAVAPMIKQQYKREKKSRRERALYEAIDEVLERRQVREERFQRIEERQVDLEALPVPDTSLERLLQRRDRQQERLQRLEAEIAAFQAAGRNQ